MGYYRTLNFSVTHDSRAASPGYFKITVPTQYFAIYDADGSLAGEVAYTLGKIAGRRHCALCDISHGWNPRGKAVWRDGAQLACRVQWLHRDEQSREMFEYTRGRLPMVLAQTGSAFHTLLGTAALEVCGGEYPAFVAALSAAVKDVMLVDEQGNGVATSLDHAESVVSP